MSTNNRGTNKIKNTARGANPILLEGNPAVLVQPPRHVRVNTEGVQEFLLEQGRRDVFGAPIVMRGGDQRMLREAHRGAQDGRGDGGLGSFFVDHPRARCFSFIMRGGGQRMLREADTGGAGRTG